jgi:oxalate decarboxylase
MSNKYFFSLDAIKPQKSSAGGDITRVTSVEVSGFDKISFSSLKLNENGFLEPTWHPNANKIGYVLAGTSYVSIRTPDGFNEFSVSKGDVFFIPEGSIHYISNTGSGQSQIIFAYDNVKPQEMLLAKAVNSLSDDVFTATFNSPASFLAGLKKSKQQDVIRKLPQKNAAGSAKSPYKFNIEASKKPILTKGGYLQLATKNNLPVLNGLGILGFGLNPKGVVEPHWHTNAGELVYIVKGKTRITVLSPDGSLNVMEVNGGQGAFAPESHFHNIENVGTDDVEVVAFFNNAEPNYIGIAEVIGSYPNEVLSTIFDVSPTYFGSFKKTDKPLVIVPL